MFAFREKSIKCHSRHLSGGHRGFETHDSAVTGIDASGVFEFEFLADIGQCHFMDFEWEVIQKQILPGTTCGDGVGLEEKCPINLVGELQADRANIGPNVDQSGAVHMKTKK